MPSGRGKTRNIRAALSARDVADLRISELQQQLLETRQEMQQQNNRLQDMQFNRGSAYFKNTIVRGHRTPPKPHDPSCGHDGGGAKPGARRGNRGDNNGAGQPKRPEAPTVRVQPSRPGVPWTCGKCFSTVRAHLLYCSACRAHKSFAIPPSSAQQQTGTNTYAQMAANQTVAGAAVQPPIQSPTPAAPTNVAADLPIAPNVEMDDGGDDSEQTKDEAVLEIEEERKPKNPALHILKLERKKKEIEKKRGDKLRGIKDKEDFIEAQQQELQQLKNEMATFDDQLREVAEEHADYTRLLHERSEATKAALGVPTPQNEGDAIGAELQRVASSACQLLHAHHANTGIAGDHVEQHLVQSLQLLSVLASRLGVVPAVPVQPEQPEPADPRQTSLLQWTRHTAQHVVPAAAPVAQSSAPPAVTGGTSAAAAPAPATLPQSPVPVTTASAPAVPQRFQLWSGLTPERHSTVPKTPSSLVSETKESAGHLPRRGRSRGPRSRTRSADMGDGDVDTSGGQPMDELPGSSGEMPRKTLLKELSQKVEADARRPKSRPRFGSPKSRAAPY